MQVRRNNIVVIKCIKDETIRLSVIDIRGRVVATVKDAVYTAGTYNIPLNIDGCGSNTCFVKIATNGNEVVQKVTFLI